MAATNIVQIMRHAELKESVYRMASWLKAEVSFLSAHVSSPTRLQEETTRCPPVWSVLVPSGMTSPTPCSHTLPCRLACAYSPRACCLAEDTCCEDQHVLFGRGARVALADG